MACSVSLSPLSDACQCSSIAALVRVSGSIALSLLAAWVHWLAALGHHLTMAREANGHPRDRPWLGPWLPRSRVSLMSRAAVGPGCRQGYSRARYVRARRDADRAGHGNHHRGERSLYISRPPGLPADEVARGKQA